MFPRKMKEHVAAEQLQVVLNDTAISFWFQAWTWYKNKFSFVGEQLSFQVGFQDNLPC